MADFIGGHLENDVKVTWHEDRAEGRLIIKREQDVESVLDAVARLTTTASRPSTAWAARSLNAGRAGDGLV